MEDGVCQRMGVAEGNDMGCGGRVDKGKKDRQRRDGGRSKGRGRGDEPIEIVEEAEEVEAELDEGLFLVVWEGAEYLCGIVHVVSAAYPEGEASVSGGVRGEKMVTGGR